MKPVVIGFDHVFTEDVVFVCNSQYRKIVAQWTCDAGLTLRDSGGADDGRRM